MCARVEAVVPNVDRGRTARGLRRAALTAVFGAAELYATQAVARGVAGEGDDAHLREVRLNFDRRASHKRHLACVLRHLACVLRHLAFVLRHLACVLRHLACVLGSTRSCLCLAQTSPCLCSRFHPFMYT